jgi:hypothetical protein
MSWMARFKSKNEKLRYPHDGLIPSTWMNCCVVRPHRDHNMRAARPLRRVALL